MIYARGRPRGFGAKKSRETYKFDARDLIARFRNYDATGDAGANAEHDGQDSSTNEAKKESGSSSTASPFIWARDLPLDRICICEMGAKAVPPAQEDPDGPLLGQAYRVVAERKLEF